MADPIHYRDDPAHTPTNEDGTTIPGGPWVKYDSTDAFHDSRPYTRGNGMIAVVPDKHHYVANDSQGYPKKSVPAMSPSWATRMGDVFLGPDTELNRKILGEMGFKEEEPNRRVGLDAPPNLHRLKDPVLQHMLDFKDEMEGPLSERVALEITKLAMQNQAYKATGAKYKEPGSSEVKTVPQIRESKLLATFDVSPTGVIGFIDREGNPYIASAQRNPEIKTWLEDNGFLQVGGLAIPFAKGETIIPGERMMHNGIENFVGALQRSAAYTTGAHESGLPKQGAVKG